MAEAVTAANHRGIAGFRKPYTDVGKKVTLPVSTYSLEKATGSTRAVVSSIIAFDREASRCVSRF